MMYDYLKKLKIENGFMPSRILDIGAWNGFWTKKVKPIWPDAHFTCIEAGPKHEKRLKELTEDYHIAVLGDSNPVSTGWPWAVHLVWTPAQTRPPLGT